MRATASIDACHRNHIVTAPEVTPTADLRSRKLEDTMPARRVGRRAIEIAGFRH
jgi:hypothetical protein